MFSVIVLSSEYLICNYKIYNMKNIQVFLIPTSENFKVEDNKAIELQHLVFVPLLASFDFEYELLDLDLVQLSNGRFYVKVKILKT